MEEKILMQYQGFNGKKWFVRLLVIGLVLSIILYAILLCCDIARDKEWYCDALDTYYKHHIAGSSCGYGYSRGEYCYLCDDYLEHSSLGSFVWAHNFGKGFFYYERNLYSLIPFGAFLLFGGLFCLLANKKPWKLTEDTLTVGEKAIPLSSLTRVSHTPVKNSNYGVIQVFWGKGISDFATVAYPPKQDREGTEAAEYISKVVNPERFAKQKEIEEKGFRKRCKICGKIICYTLEDLERNKRLAKDAMWSGIGGIATALSGHYAASAVQTQTGNDELSRIIDYDKCPACGSRELVDLTDEELARINAQQNGVSVASSADELKKFKELLDMGIITQEEFEAKKKQLLGL